MTIDTRKQTAATELGVEAEAIADVQSRANTPESYYRDLLARGEDPTIAASAVDAAFGFTPPPAPWD